MFKCEPQYIKENLVFANNNTVIPYQFYDPNFAAGELCSSPELAGECFKIKQQYIKYYYRLDANYIDYHILNLGVTIPITLLVPTLENISSLLSSVAIGISFTTVVFGMFGVNGMLTAHLILEPLLCNEVITEQSDVIFYGMLKKIDGKDWLLVENGSNLFPLIDSKNDIIVSNSGEVLANSVIVGNDVIPGITNAQIKSIVAKYEDNIPCFKGDAHLQKLAIDHQAFSENKSFQIKILSDVILNDWSFFNESILAISRINGHCYEYYLNDN